MSGNFKGFIILGRVVRRPCRRLSVRVYACALENASEWTDDSVMLCYVLYYIVLYGMYVCMSVCMYGRIYTHRKMIMQACTSAGVSILNPLGSLCADVRQGRPRRQKL